MLYGPAHVLERVRKFHIAGADIFREQEDARRFSVGERFPMSVAPYAVDFDCDRTGRLVVAVQRLQFFGKRLEKFSPDIEMLYLQMGLKRLIGRRELSRSLR